MFALLPSGFVPLAEVAGPICSTAWLGLTSSKRLDREIEEAKVEVSEAIGEVRRMGKAKVELEPVLDRLENFGLAFERGKGSSEW